MSEMLQKYRIFFDIQKVDSENDFLIEAVRVKIQDSGSLTPEQERYARDRLKL